MAHVIAAFGRGCLFGLRVLYVAFVVGFSTSVALLWLLLIANLAKAAIT